MRRRGTRSSGLQLHPTLASRALLRVPAVLGLLLLGLPAPASAISFNFVKVVETGDTATGLPAGSVFDQFFGDTLNGAGDVMFSAFVSGPSIGPEDDQVIYSAAPGGAKTLLVRQGDPAPGAGAGVVYGIPGPAVQNDSGQFAFSPHLSDGSSTFGGLYGPHPTLVAVEGDPAPGAGGATWNSFTHLIDPILNNAGELAFQANLSGTGGGSSIWGPDAGGSPTLVAVEGDQAPGFAAGVEYDGMIFDPLLNDSGRLAFRGTLGGSGGGESVLWLRDGSGTPSALVQGSGTAPDLGAGESFGSLSLLELNDTGTVIFHASLAGPLVTGSNDGSLWRSSGSGDPTLLVREGDSAPGAAGGTTFSGLLSGRLADNGLLAFAADLTGQFGQSSRALYLVDALDQLNLILETGDAAPDLAGLAIAALPDDPLIDDVGNFVFRAELSGTGVDASNDLALYYYDVTTGQLQLVIREGDSLETTPGNLRTIGTLFGPQLNDQDQLALHVSFTGGGQGIFLNAVPEPGTGLLVALGCAWLAAARRRAARGGGA